MDKRQLGWNMLLGAILFVALVHTGIALFFFETGLTDVGVLVAGVALVGLALVNL